MQGFRIFARHFVLSFAWTWLIGSALILLLAGCSLDYKDDNTANGGTNRAFSLGQRPCCEKGK